MMASESPLLTTRRHSTPGADAISLSALSAVEAMQAVAQALSLIHI